MSAHMYTYIFEKAQVYKFCHLVQSHQNQLSFRHYLYHLRVFLFLLTIPFPFSSTKLTVDGRIK